MPLSAGERLGPYEIVELIGKGGMGEVYRARDTRLKRDVAIKTSGERFSDRFEREARAVAALNHPNICQIYDVAPNYIVMELVEGEDLKGPLSLEVALHYARQIAAALGSAHDKGIVHRDLKPANIKITPQGAVKVLDFGLAKFTPPPSGDRLEENPPSNSPTVSMPAATQAGTILGTAAYMSPEQARGRNVDKRADIWAFGVVLYEMLAGERLFKGSDVSEILAGVIKEQPRLDSVPRKVQRLLAKCLEKDPERRLRDIADAWDLLDGIAPPTSRFGTVGWICAAVLLAALGAGSFFHFRETQAKLTLRTSIALPEGATYIHSLVISPDGRQLAIAATIGGKQRLWLRPLDSLQTREMPGTDGAVYPFWSPDSRHIGFFAQNKLMKVDASGGPPQAVCFASEARGGSWNQEDLILFSSTDGGGFGIRSVPAAAGIPSEIVKLAQGLSRFPTFLPDGRHFLFEVSRASPEVNGVYWRSLDGKDNRRVLPDESSAVFTAGRLLFVRENALMAEPFDPVNGQALGDSLLLANDVPKKLLNVNYVPVTGSEIGVLVYEAGGTEVRARQIARYDRGGKLLGAVGAPGMVEEPAISPDQTSVVYPRDHGTGTDLLLRDLAHGGERLFNTDPAFGFAPIWSPQGDRIAFRSNRSTGIFNLYQKKSNGTGQDEPLFVSEKNKIPTQWSREGFIVYSEVNPKTKEDIWVLPTENGAPGKPSVFLDSDFNEGFGQISPDSRWMAYTSDESGRREVYVRRFPSREDPKTISTAGGEQPRWSRDGKVLYFVAADGNLMIVAVKVASGTRVSFEAGSPQPLFDPAHLTLITGGNSYQYDVTADGKGFLLATAVGGQAAPAPSLTVVVNWDASFKK
jgi:Tol biopolymer transport system component/predicted Ser/Thr protein kinase